MATTGKDLNAVGEIPEDLRNCYRAVMDADLGLISAGAIKEVESSCEKSAILEGSVNGLQTNSDGISQGMMNVIRLAASHAYESWLRIRRPFDAALQPHKEKIDSVLNFEARKKDIEDRRQEKEAAIVQQAESSRNYVDRKTAKQDADRFYDTLLQGEGGRPVTTFGQTWLYILILVAITSIEWLINFDSFLAWTGIPALAAGFTIGAAAAVALAAHVHGEYLKQRNSRFGLGSETRGRDTTFLVLATVALLAAIAVAGWARYSFAIHDAVSNGPTIPVPGEDAGSGHTNPATDVLVSLGVNLIVWLIGLVISFMAHDENHKLMRASLERWNCTRRFNKAHKPWQGRIKLVKEQAALELNQLIAATRLATSATQAQRDMLVQVESRERDFFSGLANRLGPSLHHYQITLAEAAKRAGTSIQVGGSALGAEQYQRITIAIDAQLIRNVLEAGGRNAH